MTSVADEILGRMRDDEESDWPERLVEALNAEHVYRWRSEPQPITEAERRVLFALSVGLTPTMTAEVLGISVNTVRTHLVEARRVLGAKNTTHAVALALRQGLIP